MSRTPHEGKSDKRDAKLRKMREQVASGDLRVRQMIPDERAHWDEHSAASARDATPEERARRNKALEKRARVQEIGRARAARGSAPPSKTP
jgi:hypothetical protein